MKDSRFFRSRVGGLALAFSSFCCLTLSAILDTPAVAQQRGPVQRVVQGKVTDHAGTPIKGSVIYLKDGRTLSVKSFIANDQGEYRFGQLAQNTDYSLWAEHEGKKSPVKSISSFDNKNQFYIDLKVDMGK